MTRCLVVADIHSNLVALDAVLDEVQRSGGFDELWLLGDIVGYGPDPSGCIERVRAYRCLCVAGNHDFGVTGSIDLAAFNPDADLNENGSVDYFDLFMLAKTFGHVGCPACP